ARPQANGRGYGANLCHEPRRITWSRRLDYTGVSVWLGALRSLASIKTRVTSGNAALISRSIRDTAASTSPALRLSSKSRLPAASTSCGPKCMVSTLIGADDAWCYLGDALD